LQHFALDRISAEQFSDYVQNQLPDAGASQQQLLMNLSNQMPLQALEVAQSAWLPLRQEFLQDWQKLVMQKNMPLAIATKWNKSLSFGEFAQMFEYLLSDLICVKLNQTVKNIDLEFNVLAEQYSLEALFKIYEDFQQAKQYLEQNVQSNLVIDELFIKLMNL